MLNLKFWLRWSWRDLRARWLQVVAIALIISLGTGVAAGLGGQKQWRIRSMEVSYARLNAYDLRLRLTDGSFVETDALRTALADVEGVRAFELRLATPTLVDASHDGTSVLVQGRIVGVNASDAGPQVEQIYVTGGRALTAADDGADVVVVENAFAKYYDLKPGSPIRVSGGTALDFVATGQTPEYFHVVPEGGLLVGESNFAVLFTPLATAQRLAGRAGMVNNAVFKVEDGADLATVEAAIEARMAEAFPRTGYTMNPLADDAAWSALYSDAVHDQDIWSLISLLFLVGASLGAFNLAGRIVDAQRRQIGIGMALGVPRRWLAVRPLLVGLQIALLGTLFGFGVAWLLTQAFAELLRTYLPLPYWEFDFYLPGYARALVLGILLPFIATLIPVIRAVRTRPIDAIRTGNLIAKGGGLNGRLAVVKLPGRSFTQMPLRNLIRAPWRTLLTVTGISLAVVLLITFAGFMDSFVATMDQAETAFLHQSPDRIEVTLDFFYTADSEPVRALTALHGENGRPLFAATETALMIGGKLRGAGRDFDALLEVHDMANAIWTPQLEAGALGGGGPGLILSAKAAEDLDVQVGDTVALEHPLRQGLFSFRLVESEVPVVGIHDNPLRALVYMDASGADLMGLGQMTNLLIVEPAPGVSGDEIKRALMTQPGVTAVQEISWFSKAFNDTLSLFTTLIAVIEIVVLVMAFLIAFNSTSINVDERVREISTMFAFGLPVRTVARMQMLENLIIGLLGTVLGAFLGWVVLNAILVARVEDQLAEYEFAVTLSLGTLAIALGLGVLVVTLTPLLSLRRMMRLDLPSALRVME